MGDKTAIEWTDATWNPVTGCTKVSQGCKNCYAERVFPRAYGPTRKFTDVQTHPDRLDQPLRWKKPRRIFVNSMSDLFHEAVPDEFIQRVFQTMFMAPQHTFQVLTKRPARMHDLMMQWRAEWGADLWAPAKNIHLGVSCEDQETADERIPLLLQTPAAVRFVSAEPLLGPIDLRNNWQPEGIRIDWLTGCDGTDPDIPGLDWLIVGGESGPNARPMHPDWARSLRDQCQAAGVSFFFKQWGEWAPIQYVSQERNRLLNITCSDKSRKERLLPGETGKPETWCNVKRVGKKAAGAMLDGREWKEFPA